MMDTLASLSEKITGAELAQKKWRTISLNKRIEFTEKFNDALYKHKKDFIKLIVAEILKPRAQARDEVERTVDMVAAFCSAGQNCFGEVLRSGDYPGYKNNKIAIVGRQPLGTVLCISPFNYPLNEAVAKIVPALLMGNAVLFKPASVGFKVGELIAKCMGESQLPENIFNLIDIKNSNKKSQFSVFGCQLSDRSQSVIGYQSLETERQKTDKLISENRKQKTENRDSLLDYVVSHPLIDCINFTGSTETAEHISHICGIKKLVLGLSGKDASLVFDDADLRLTAKEIVSGAFSYAGQRCTGIKRVLVDEKVHAEFMKNLESRILNLETGELESDKTTFGPVISESHADYIQELVVDAENLGSKISRFQILNSKFGLNKWGSKFILPTLINNVTSDMRIAWEEPFGPVLPITVFETPEEAIKLCNQSSFGLQNSVFTTNINFAFDVAERLECGVVNINGKDARGPDNFPFLGVKKSGLGVVGGIKYLLEEMSTIKSVVISSSS
jgi:glyceraldehyde-3-phosphate dehydrogenase (NADP+)